MPLFLDKANKQGKAPLKRCVDGKELGGRDSFSTFSCSSIYPSIGLLFFLPFIYLFHWGAFCGVGLGNAPKSRWHCMFRFDWFYPLILIFLSFYLFLLFSFIALSFFFSLSLSLSLSYLYLSLESYFIFLASFSHSSSWYFSLLHSLLGYDSSSKCWAICVPHSTSNHFPCLISCSAPEVPCLSFTLDEYIYTFHARTLFPFIYLDVCIHTYIFFPPYVPSHMRTTPSTIFMSRILCSSCWWVLPRCAGKPCCPGGWAPSTALGLLGLSEGMHSYYHHHHYHCCCCCCCRWWW